MPRPTQRVRKVGAEGSAPRFPTASHPHTGGSNSGQLFCAWQLHHVTEGRASFRGFLLIAVPVHTDGLNPDSSRSEGLHDSSQVQ